MYKKKVFTRISIVVKAYDDTNTFHQRCTKVEKFAGNLSCIY